MEHIHVNKLPSSRYFTPSDLKQFLPFHQQTAIENLKIIFHNYALSKYPKNLILLPDDNLSLQYDYNGSYYTYLKGIWCEDFDKQSELLKNSLSFASNMLNYVSTIDQDSPVEEVQHESQSFIRRIDVITVVNGERIATKNKRYRQIKQEKTTIGVKFEKINTRIYMILGVNIKTRESLALSCAILRQWNLRRLNVKNTNIFDIDLIHRICEHFFCMARGFGRQVNADYNTFHANLTKFVTTLAKLDLGAEETLFNKFTQLKLNSNTIPHEVTVMKCSVTFRKEVNQVDTWELISQFVTQWLLQTPINVSCSYASHVQSGQNGVLTLVFASHYQSSEKNKYAQQNDLLNDSKKVQLLLFDETFKKREDPNSVKNSMIMMTKYQPKANEKSQKNQASLVRQQTPPEMNVSLNQSMMSQIQSQSQSRKSNIKNIAKLENQIYQILKFLDSKKKILTPNQMQNIVRVYLKKLKERQPEAGLIGVQYEAIQTLHAINQQITAQEFYLLIRNNFNQSGIIVPYFFQKNRYVRAIATGRLLAADHLQKVFRQSLKSGLLASRHTIIPYYLKKLTQFYHPQITASPLKITQISIPQLVQIIQKKQYTTHLYASIVTILLPQIFTPFNSIIKMLAPLLYYFVQFLTKLGHHVQLVMTFVGELLYEVCYFGHEAKINMLTNMVYREDQYAKVLTLKEKKVIEMLRQGGLKGFGFDIKTLLITTLQQNKTEIEHEQHFYSLIRVQRPTQLLQFYKLLSSCHYTHTINKIAKFLDYKNQYSNVLNHNRPMIAYFFVENTQQKDILQIPTKQELPGGNQEVKVDSEFNSIAERILKSESGIFQDMVRLNPTIKIAGIELKSAMKTLSTSRIQVQSQPATQAQKRGQIIENQDLDKILYKSIHGDYQYVQLAISSKGRYINYHTLSEVEKSHFRDCAATVVQHRDNVMQYVALNDKIKIIRDLN